MKTVVVALVAAVLGAATVGIAEGSPPVATSSSFTESQILRELQRANRELGAIKYNTGALCEDSPHGFVCAKF